LINTTHKQLSINHSTVNFSTPKVMGILNITKDSFFADSRLKTDKELLKTAEKHIKDGATFLDIGAMSSRPGAKIIPQTKELKIVQKATSLINKEFPQIFISVDTFRASVAKSAIEHGATIINDISGFSFDEQLINVIASQNVAYVLMHIQGDFENMHNVVKNSINKTNIEQTVNTYFLQKLEILRQKKIENVIIDPGFGFSKTLSENYQLLHNLNLFQQLKQPLLVGLSRKSMIYKVLKNNPKQALNGTTVLNTLAILKGANIIRVHDVKYCKEIIDLLFFQI